MYSKRKFIFSLLATCALVSGLIVVNTLNAAQTSFNLELRAQAIGNCLINSATDIDFGVLVAGTQPTHDLAGMITYACSPGIRGFISLDGGSTNGNMLDRAMLTSSSYQLKYQLYIDDTYSNVWGDGTVGTERLRTKGGRGLPRPREIEVYARINDTDLLGADSGNYSDVITVTFDF